MRTFIKYYRALRTVFNKPRIIALKTAIYLTTTRYIATKASETSSPLMERFLDSLLDTLLYGLFRNKKSVTIVEDYEQRVTEEDAVSEEVKAWKKDIQIEQSVTDEVKLFGEEFLMDYPFTKNEMRVIARNQGGEYRYSGKLRLGFIHYN